MSASSWEILLKYIEMITLALVEPYAVESIHELGNDDAGRQAKSCTRRHIDNQLEKLIREKNTRILYTRTRPHVSKSAIRSVRRPRRARKASCPRGRYCRDGSERDEKIQRELIHQVEHGNESTANSS